MTLLATSVAVGCAETDEPDDAATTPIAADEHAALVFDGRAALIWHVVDERLRPEHDILFQLCDLGATDGRDGSFGELDCATIADNGRLDRDREPGQLAIDGLGTGRYRLAVAGVSARRMIDTHTEIFDVRQGSDRLVIDEPFVISPGARVPGTVAWEVDTSRVSIPRAGAEATFEICALETVGPRLANWCLQVTDGSLVDADLEPGAIAVTALPDGDYAVTQVGAADGVVFDVNSRTVRINARQRRVEVDPPFAMRDTDTRVDWAIIDGDTSEPIGGAAFRLCQTHLWVGGEFERIGESNCLAVTDGDSRDLDRRAGHVAVASLELGRWIVVSQRAPRGYLANTQSSFFTLTPTTPRASLGAVFSYTTVRSPEGCSATYWIDNVDRWDDDDDEIVATLGLRADMTVERLLRIDGLGPDADLALIDVLRLRERSLELELVRTAVLTLLDVAAHDEARDARALAEQIFEQLSAITRDDVDREARIKRLIEDLAGLNEAICAAR